MNAIFLNLIFLFVAALSTTQGGVLPKETNSSRVISMPLLEDNLRATLKADVDTRQLNNYIKAYTKQEVQDSFQQVQDMVGGTIADIKRANEEEVTKMNDSITDIKRANEEELTKMNESIKSTLNRTVVEIKKVINEEVTKMKESIETTLSFSNYSSILFNKKYKDCTELKERERGPHWNGIYTIYPDPYGEGVQAYCDMKTDGGGWTVIQKRFDGSVDFQRTWDECKNGFGNVKNEFWFGNKYIHHMTSRRNYELRVDLLHTNGTKQYAIYKTFMVGNEKSQYPLTVGEFSGNTLDLLKNHNGRMFSTIDQNNDYSSRNCATSTGPWWHRRCYSGAHSNLNTKYEKKIDWGSSSYIKSAMMIRQQ